MKRILAFFLLTGFLIPASVIPAFADESTASEETSKNVVKVEAHQGGGFLWESGEYKNYTVIKLLGTKTFTELPESWPGTVKFLAADLSLNIGGAYDTAALRDGVATVSKRVGSLGDALSFLFTVPDWVNKIDLNIAFAGLYCKNIFGSDRKFDGISGADFTGKISFEW